MGTKNIYQRFIWFDDRVRQKKYPNTTSLVWHKDQKTRILKEGSLEVSFSVGQFSEIAREILKHGSGVEVIEPESLRQLIKSETEKILKIYQ